MKGNKPPTFVTVMKMHHFNHNEVVENPTSRNGAKFSLGPTSNPDLEVICEGKISLSKVQDNRGGWDDSSSTHLLIKALMALVT